jgi:glycosyltransferase involved in cell wall biosynthesis
MRARSTPGAKLLSVVIPSFNCAGFLAEAIGSVYRQTYRPLELIVVDDGSTDTSRDVIERVCRRSEVDRLTVIEQPNEGAHAAINRGLEAASGEYLSILNSDDYYAPERFSLLVPYLEAGHGMVFSGARFVDAAGRDLPASHGWPGWYRQALADSESCPTVGYSLLLHNYSVTSGNFLFTHALYQDLGRFHDYRLVHDWDFLLRSMYYTEPVFVRERLISYRIHAANATESLRDRLFGEASDALGRYMRLCDSGAPPNSLAPCACHWPRFFDRFASRHSPFFADDRPLRELLEVAESAQ